MGQKANSAMQIDVIDDITHLLPLKNNWTDIYRHDPDAPFQLSWTWMSNWFEKTTFGWKILGVRETAPGPYIAFLPLGVQKKRHNRFITTTSLLSAGSHWADHSGFLCRPAHENEALAALADYLKHQEAWDHLLLYEMYDPRTESFLSHFNGGAFSVTVAADTDCPFITLPGSWDLFCENTLSKRSRKDLEYYRRRIERDTDYRQTSVSLDNLGESIDALLDLYRQRRNPGTDLSVDRFRNLLFKAFGEDLLWLDVLWDGDKPMAAYSGFVDEKSSTFVGCNTGFDETYSKLRPGTIVVAESVKYAIERGLRFYDFGRGTEPYKYKLGGHDRKNRNIEIARKGAGVIIKQKLIHTHALLKKAMKGRRG